MLGKLGVDAEAINMHEESEGYLIKIHYGMELNIQLISMLVACYVYGMQIKDEGEREELLLKMGEFLLFLIDKKAMLKKDA